VTAATARAAAHAVGGRAVSLDEAAAEAARLLAASRAAVIGGMRIDAAGAEAAVDLAETIGAALDHADAAALLRDLDAMRETGWIVTAPPEVRARADAVLLVGPVSGEGLGLDGPPTLLPEVARVVWRLYPGHSVHAHPGEHRISGAAEEAGGLLGVLRALVARRPVAAHMPHHAQLATCAEALRGARYAVVVWSAETLDALAVEAACGLVEDLNASTRAAGLPWPAGGNAMGVARTVSWRCGFPMRVGFGAAAPSHDPWRFDAARLIAAGEADVAMWIDAIAGEAPRWPRSVPLVALVPPDTRFRVPPAVRIAVGRAGVDHDAVLFDPAIGEFAARPGSAPSDLPSVSAVLERITVAIRAEARC
jgi:formylmethanofuran dehydrogenase subunit B